jgi:hypothetical protein
MKSLYFQIKLVPIRDPTDASAPPLEPKIIPMRIPETDQAVLLTAISIYHLVVLTREGYVGLIINGQMIQCEQLAPSGMNPIAHTLGFIPTMDASLFIIDAKGYLYSLNSCVPPPGGQLPSSSRSPIPGTQSPSMPAMLPRSPSPNPLQSPGPSISGPPGAPGGPRGMNQPPGAQGMLMQSPNVNPNATLRKGSVDGNSGPSAEAAPLSFSSRDQDDSIPLARSIAHTPQQKPLLQPVSILKTSGNMQNSPISTAPLSALSSPVPTSKLPSTPAHVHSSAMNGVSQSPLTKSPGTEPSSSDMIRLPFSMQKAFSNLPPTEAQTPSPRPMGSQSPNSRLMSKNKIDTSRNPRSISGKRTPTKSDKSAMDAELIRKTMTGQMEKKTQDPKPISRKVESPSTAKESPAKRSQAVEDSKEVTPSAAETNSTKAEEKKSVPPSPSNQLKKSAVEQNEDESSPHVTEKIAMQIHVPSNVIPKFKSPITNPSYNNTIASGFTRRESKSQSKPTPSPKPKSKSKSIFDTKPMNFPVKLSNNPEQDKDLLVEILLTGDYVKAAFFASKLSEFSLSDIQSRFNSAVRSTPGKSYTKMDSLGIYSLLSYLALYRKLNSGEACTLASVAFELGNSDPLMELLDHQLLTPSESLGDLLAFYEAFSSHAIEMYQHTGKHTKAVRLLSNANRFDDLLDYFKQSGFAPNDVHLLPQIIEEDIREASYGRNGDTSEVEAPRALAYALSLEQVVQKPNPSFLLQTVTLLQERAGPSTAMQFLKSTVRDLPDHEILQKKLLEQLIENDPAVRFHPFPLAIIIATIHFIPKSFLLKIFVYYCSIFVNL